MASKLPKSINLLNPVTAPGDVWTGLYEWVFNVGKYLLVGVQVVVLLVFFSRFIFDKKNNDLTDDINEQVAALNESFFKNKVIQYNNLHGMLKDVALLNEYQITNTANIGGLISSIPSEIRLEQLSFNEGNVSMNFASSDEDAIRGYERQLDENPLYENVRVTFSQTGSSSEVAFSVTFSFVKDVENILIPLD